MYFTKPLASPTFSTKFPFCCSLAVFFGLLTTSYELFLALDKYFHIPLSHPHISTMGYNITGEELEILITLYVIFITVSQPIPVGLQPLTCSDCEFESR